MLSLQQAKLSIEKLKEESKWDPPQPCRKREKVYPFYNPEFFRINDEVEDIDEVLRAATEQTMDEDY